MMATMAKQPAQPPPWDQLPLFPNTPGMEFPGAHVRRQPMSPGEHELEDARRIADPGARALNVERIERRTVLFKNAFHAWRAAHRHETHVTNDKVEEYYDGCDRCGNRITDACLLYNQKAYCATCRNEVWQELGKRVGFYL